MFTKTSSWTRLKSIQSSLVLFSACFELLLYVYTNWKSAVQLLFLYDQRRRLWTRESIFEKYPIALKLTHVIFGQKSYWFRWGLRDTFGFAQAWTARHFWTVEDLKTYWLLRADILWILRLQGRKRAEIRYSFIFF